VSVSHIVSVAGSGDAVDVGRHAVTSWVRVWKRIYVAWDRRSRGVVGVYLVCMWMERVMVDLCHLFRGLQLVPRRVCNITAMQRVGRRSCSVHRGGIVRTSWNLDTFDAKVGSGFG